MPSLPDRLIIALVGPCGSGKSTMASFLSEIPGVDIVQELPPMVIKTDCDYHNLDISAMQLEFLTMRLRQAMVARSGVVVFDRTIEEDRCVFLQLHYELGGLNDVELAKLDKIAKGISKQIGVPSATVVIHAETDILRHRIGNGNRPAWLEASFDRQLELYSAFISNIKGAVLDIDTTFRTPADLQLLSAWIVETARLVATQEQRCENQKRGLQWEWREN